MRRVVMCGVPAALLALFVGVTRPTDASATERARPHAGAAAVAVAAPITASAQVGPARALRMWSECVTDINAVRAGAGAGPLHIDLRVTLAAFAHSGDQAAAQAMSHTDAGNTNAGLRLQAAGYTWSAWGENVAAGQADCDTVMTAWLGSRAHRENIMNPSFRDVGIGMAIGANGVPYWTMDFAAAR